MQYNVGKCGVMHIGHSNRGHQYEMNGQHLNETKLEKDLGVYVHQSLKPSQHIAAAVQKANQVLGMIKRNITNKSTSVITKLYKELVRPHLEYGVQAWSPWLKKDIDKLEAVQRRASRMIPEIKGLTYEERLGKMGLTTLATRRYRGDMLEVFKLVKGLEGIEAEELFTYNTSTYTTRGHTHKLEIGHSRLDVRKKFFTRRVLGPWNRLPPHVVSPSTTDGFKRTNDRHIMKTVINGGATEGYPPTRP